jgi:hypothetical protein
LLPTTIKYSNASYCQNQPGQVNPTPEITGPTGGEYAVLPSGLEINPSTGVVDLSISKPGKYTVTYEVKNVGCSVKSSTEIAVGEKPTVNEIISQTVCDEVNFKAINFTGSPGTDFSWINSDTSIGLSTKGIGDIAAFTGNNKTKNSISSIITVTPTIGTCIGKSETFTLTVNPSDR